jgi:Uma2 family endonuclease
MGVEVTAMPSVLAEPTELTEAHVAERRKRWTRTEVQNLVAAGQLPESGYELIEGDILTKMPKNRPHVYTTQQVTFALADIFGREYVQSQDPVALSEISEPEPDICVLRRPQRDYLSSGTPLADEAHLVVEVSDTTLDFDTTVKAALYARALVADYWVVDIVGRRMIVHREPVDGHYQDVLAYTEDESVSPLTAPAAYLRVGDLLP